MKFIIAAALLAASSPAFSATVEVASGDWSAIPLVKSSDFPGMTPDAIARIRALIVSGECVLPGQSKRKIDMRIPFLIQFQPDGGVSRVVLSKVGCPKVEGIIGGVVLGLADQGAYRPTGDNPAGWYRSEISFSAAEF
jgi:hypothetical protein